MPKKKRSLELGEVLPAKKRECVPALKVSELLAKAASEPTRGTFDYRFGSGATCLSGARACRQRQRQSSRDPVLSTRGGGKIRPCASAVGVAPDPVQVLVCLLTRGCASRRPQAFWRASPQGPSAIKGVVSGLKKCLQVVKTLIKKKGGVYFCDPVSVLFRCPAPSSSYLVSQIAHVRGKRSQKGS